MYKILMVLLLQCLVSGCMVAVPLCMQLKNMEPSRVCPMPMPACKRAFEWGDDIGYRPKQQKPTDADRPEVYAGSKDFNYDEKICFTLSDDFQGSISLVDDD